MTKILIDRAVVEQALEALRCVDLQSLVPDYGSGHYSVARLDGPQVKSAITAMEAALAEPVQDDGDEKIVAELRRLHAQRDALLEALKMARLMLIAHGETHAKINAAIAQTEGQ